MYHPDELFQIAEFAGYKLGWNQLHEMPWEYSAEMRSGLMPWLVYQLSRCLIYLNFFNPFAIATIFRCLASLISYTAFIGLLNHYYDHVKIGKWANLGYLLCVLFWPLPFFHARFSAENISTALVILGMLIHLKANQNTLKLILAGLLFGLAIHIRFHALFFVGAYLGWHYLLISKKPLILVYTFLGFTLAIATGITADYWLYSKLTFSPCNYVLQNVVYQKAADYGVQPFYFYISESIIMMLPPFSLVLIGCLIYFWFKKPKHLLTALTFLFALPHFFIGHKELRFLFPLLNFLPIMMCLLWPDFKSQLEKGYVRFILKSFVVVNFITVLILAFVPANSTFLMLNRIYDFTKDKPAYIVYKTDDPYNDLNSLHYFRNNKIRTVHLDSLKNLPASDTVCLYIENNYNAANELTLSGKKFKREHSTFPNWIKYFNFNNWLERASCSVIYVNQR
jgi:phosphatidylinositol glycan class B